MLVNYSKFLLIINVSVLLLIFACDNSIGLGSKINTEVPVIKMPDDPNGTSSPGSFLSGNKNIIYFDAFIDAQGFNIKALYITLDYTDKQNEKRTETVAASFDKNTKKWSVNIDTISLNMEDGLISAKATAIDSSGKRTTTTDIIYYVKNLPPQIQMTIPKINTEDFCNPKLNEMLENEAVYIGMELMGIATDNLGIMQGYPKIMIWPSGIYLNTNNLPLDSRYNDWHELVVPKRENGLTATKFSWPMYEFVHDASVPGDYRLPNDSDENPPVYLRPGEYYFKIWIKDIRGKDNFYPHYPNQYIKINYIASEIPIISFTNVPAYYNGADDFIIRFNITSSTMLSKIEAFIRDKDDGTHTQNINYKEKSFFKLINQNGNTYGYELSIPKDDVRNNWVQSDDGNFYIYISAEDSNQRTSPASYRNFIYDTQSPNIKIERPVNIREPKFKGKLTNGDYEIYYPSAQQGPKWITGETQIGAIASDSFGIKEIYYYIGKLGDDMPNAVLTDAQREKIYDSVDWENTNLHTSEPVKNDAYEGKWSGTLYAWNYTCNFNNFQKMNNLIQNEIDLGFSANQSEFKTSDETRFYLPFYVKVIDKALNQTIIHYKLCVDPDLDTPIVNINYPVSQLVGGEIRMSGIASDNNAVHSVHARIIKYDKNKKGTFYIPDGTNTFYPNTSFPVFANETDRQGWFKVNVTGEGNMVNWYYNINADGGLDPEDSDTQALVEIQVRAFDTKDVINRLTPDKAGLITKLEVFFSSGVPTISNPILTRENQEDKAYTDNIRMRGKFTINTTLRDDDGIRQIRARFNGSPYIKITEEGQNLTGLPSGWSISEEVYNPLLKKHERHLSITIDSTDSNSFKSFGYGKTGNLILDIQVIDMNSASYSTNASFKIGIDNFYPYTTINTQKRASGTSFRLQGSAKDYNDTSGTIQGIERVLVFFEKALISGEGAKRTVTGTGEFLNQRGQNWTSLAPAVTYPNVRDTTIADGYGGAHGPNVRNFSNFPALKLVNKGNIGDVWESEHAMVIDRQEIGETIDVDMDGTFGEVWEGSADIEWMAFFNTNIKDFPDGPLMVHYIIMDEAGNATRYKNDIYIENNKPLITYINLGTDWNGDENVEAWNSSVSFGEFLKEKRAVGITTAAASKINFAPEFRIRNKKFTLMIDTLGGNGVKEYRVSYVTPNVVPVSASNLERGKVYTITEHGGIDWVKYGAPNNNLNTTFVATDKHTGITSAKAISYKEYRTKNGTFTGESVNNINFTDADFGLEQNGLIPDSNKDTKGIVSANYQNMRYFIISVYDSTVAGRPCEDQNAHAVLIALDIDNIDSRKPEIVINPFHWNGINDNSLYENSKENGHIEFEKDLPRNKFGLVNSGIMDIDPKVSGLISVRGTAFDNNTVQKILFTFAGAVNTAAEFDSKKGWTTKGSLNNGGAWQFIIEKSEYDSKGHHVNWKLDIDTSKIISAAAQADCVMTISAKDNKETNSSEESTLQTSEAKKTSYYRMDIVPYIKKIGTYIHSAGAIRDTNIRSADGKYSIRRDKLNTISVEGFNLNPTGVKGEALLLSAEYNETKFNPVIIPPLNSSGVTRLNVNMKNNYNSLEIINSELYKSGYLTIWTNGIAALNNINYNDATGNFIKISNTGNMSNGYNEENMPNREADRYTTKNITLTDDRYIQFYHVVDTGLSNSSYPVMIMNGDNPVFGYVKDNGGSAITAGTAAGTGAGSLNPTYAAPQRRETDGVTGAEIYTEYLIKGSMWDGMGMTCDESGRYMHATTFARDQSSFHLIYDRFCELHNPTSGNGWGTGVSFGSANLVFAHAGNNNAFSLETVNYSGTLNIFRYQYPKLYARGNSNTAAGAAFYLLYFDEVKKELAFRNFRISNNGSTVSPANWIHLSSTGSDAAGNNYNFNHTNMKGYDGAGFVSTSGVPSGQYDNAKALEARKTAASNASKYFDFAVTIDNRVIIIYYDETASRLKLRYSATELKGETPAADIAWVDSSILFPVNVGMYVSMISDANALHISANDSNSGDLMYIIVPDYTKTDFRAVAVDKYGTTGNWTDIKLLPGTSGESAVPYIAYFNMADIGSRESNKIAWLKQGIGKHPTGSVTGVPSGADQNGFTTGKWEYASIPAINAPAGGSGKFRKVNLGFRGKNTPIIGYLSTNIEFAYPVGEF